MQFGHSPHEQAEAGPSCHQAHQGADLERAISEAVDHCEKRGVQLTPVRQKTLEILLSSHRPMKAYDMMGVLSSPLPAKPPTIYRALDFLVQNGLAHRIESLNAFIACGVHGCRRDVAFLICENCGLVDEREAKSSRADLDQWADMQNFAIATCVIEARGVCASCRALT